MVVQIHTTTNGRACAYGSEDLFTIEDLEFTDENGGGPRFPEAGAAAAKNAAPGGFFLASPVRFRLFARRSKKQA